MNPLIEDVDFTLHVGDALETLRGLPDESVHMCVTSPPYWGLRDYGANGQLGLEPTPEEYVANMVNVFREVRRVLRRDGTLWLNIGDSYAASSTYNTTNSLHTEHGWKQDAERRPNVRAGDGLKPKDLVGIPWRLAFALQADGWHLRSEITWCKRNCMPESVTDRPTKATEKVFLLTRSPRYFYDADAVREPHSPDGRRMTTIPVGENSHENHAGRNGHERWPGSGRNLRDWWEIATESFAEAHFATFPQKLVEPCILAGTSERGCCPECGAPWERETERERTFHHTTTQPSHEASPYAKQDAGGIRNGVLVQSRTTGWRPTCECLCPTCAVESNHGASRVRELPGDVRAEVGQQSVAATAVLRTKLREPVQRAAAATADEDIEGLPSDSRAGAPVSVETGLCDGASSGDGGCARATADVGRSCASPEREEGRQPSGELGSHGEANARQAGEEAPASDGVSSLRRADRRSESSSRCARCDVELTVTACVVLDPFLGSGTSALVARRLGRKTIGIELSAEYAQLAARRLQQLSLLADA